MCTMAVPSEKSTVLSIMSILGIIGCGASFDTGYLITKELFPTVLRCNQTIRQLKDVHFRTTALSSASASARIGSILSPLIGFHAKL